MGCDRRCFDELDKWYQHNNCETCPGQDSWYSKPGHNFCYNCYVPHPLNNWPHEPAPAQVKEGEK
jgi:hypothetical protein